MAEYDRWTRRAAVALALGIGFVVVGCGDGGDSTVASSSTAVAELDLCEAMGDAAAAAFLATLGLGPIDEVQGRAAEGAAVCGWFVAPVGDAAPEGVLVRVEPQREGGNEVCTAPATDSVELSVDGGTGWVSETDGRVQAAVSTDEWCAYLRGPADVAPGPATAADASAALLGDVLAVLAVS